MPVAGPLATMPRFDVIKRWAEDLADQALSNVEADNKAYDIMTATTARKVRVCKEGFGGECKA